MFLKRTERAKVLFCNMQLPPHQDKHTLQQQQASPLIATVTNFHTHFTSKKGTIVMAVIFSLLPATRPGQAALRFQDPNSLALTGEQALTGKVHNSSPRLREYMGAQLATQNFV